MGLSNLPVGLLLALAARDLARQIGLGGTLAHLAALAVVGNYVVVGQLVSFENDLAVAALFLACLNYGLRYSRRGLPADLVFGAISLGLLAGVKYYALGYAAGAVAIIALLAARRGGARGAVRAAGPAGIDPEAGPTRPDPSRRVSDPRAGPPAGGTGCGRVSAASSMPWIHPPRPGSLLFLRRRSFGVLRLFGLPPLHLVRPVRGGVQPDECVLSASVQTSVTPSPE